MSVSSHGIIAQLATLGALEQAQLLQRRQLSSVELTKHYLAVVAAKNPSHHAFTYIADKRALLAATMWDRAFARNKATPLTSGLLSGVPTAIKDLGWVRMMPAQMGSESFRYFIAPKDDDSTARLRAAGLIILGKLATSEFGAMPVTEPSLHAPTENAHAPGYTAGGSSGGTGSAVGAGMIPIGHGSDGGGSIRIPASVNHVVGFKHSRGVGVHNAPPDRKLRLSVTGPLARTVSDAAAFTDLLTAWPMGLLEGLHAPLRPLRIALSTGTPLAETDPLHAAAAERVAKIFEDAGCVVEPQPWVSLTEAEFILIWKRLLANIPAVSERKMQPLTQWLRLGGRDIDLADAVRMRLSVEQQVLHWFGNYDLWISPTIASTTPRHGTVYSSTPEQTFRNILGMGAYTAPFNVSGQPAISLPVGFEPSRAGIGVQIAGRVGADALVLRAGKLVEEALGGFWPPKVA